MPDQELVRAVHERRETLLAPLPAHIDHDKFVSMSIATANTIERCDPGSVLACIYGCATIGLMPDVVLGHVYFVPFKGKCTLIVGYKGYIELARRSKMLGSVYTNLIYEGEPFRHWVNAQGPQIEHEPSLNRPKDPRKGCLGAYCLADVRGSWPQLEIVERAAINEVDRSNGRGGNVWLAHWGEMARKTAIRRASKLWPLTTELAQAVAYDEAADRNEQKIVMPGVGAIEAPDAQHELVLDNPMSDSDAPIGADEKAMIEAAEAAEKWTGDSTKIRV